jgi:homocysteine S-methyltransferase
MNRPHTPTPGRVLVLDGGTGSELRRRGVAFREACWSAEANLSQVETLTAIHRDYLEAGADILTVNTFATTRFVLAAAGLDARFREINIAAIEAARRALTPPFEGALLAASLSCLAPGFDPTAFPDADSEYAGYAELAELFAELRVDLLLLEMMQDSMHAARACRAARASGLPFWIGLSCRRDPATGELVSFDDGRTPLAAVIDALLGFDPAGIAIMHSPVAAVTDALAAVGERWPGPLGAYAEVPYPEDPDSEAGAAGSGRDAATPGQYATAAMEWIASGVSLVGGCCGTTPAHVAALRRLVDGGQTPGVRPRKR